MSRICLQETYYRVIDIDLFFFIPEHEVEKGKTKKGNYFTRFTFCNKDNLLSEKSIIGLS